MDTHLNSLMMNALTEDDQPVRTGTLNSKQLNRRDEKSSNYQVIPTASTPKRGLLLSLQI